MMKSKETKVVVIAGILIIIVFAVYRWHFQGAFSANHQRWAEFGSYFGGVLGPILVFFSLLFLARQIELQRSDMKLNAQDVELRYREDYISRHLHLLKTQLDEPVNNEPFHSLILIIYRKALFTVDDPLFKLAMSAKTEAMMTWVSISIALTRIKHVNHERYREQLMLIIATVGNELSVALDCVVVAATDITMEQHFKDK
ncbi:hypothetical protein HUO09_12750 [Vibrio sp. Y2-5]|uniref:hypothetical protein n=1 Tax=Vibrio sp. Y2-5 TaxID=2743977 RepID=UPI001660FEBB|nr:hypothetical protein [Vibrio sp. Y2-5]MBD0787216.1 hypothetical protein [Vibrio sp. Y2-5]